MPIKKKEMMLLLKYASLCELKTKGYKVLLYLMPTLIDGDVVSIRYKTIVEELKLTKSDVSTAIRKLCNFGIIQPVEGAYKKNDICLKRYTIEELESMIEKILYEDDYDEDEWE